MTTSHFLLLAGITAGSMLLSHFCRDRRPSQAGRDAGGSTGYEAGFFGGDAASSCDGGSDGGCGGD